MLNEQSVGPGERLYTSFEGPVVKPVAANPQPAVRAPLLDDPDDSPLEIKVNKDSTICFFGRQHFLSSFYHAPFTINGHLYPTVEQYYEACKIRTLLGPDYANQLIGVSDPGQAKTISKRLTADVPSVVKDEWRMTAGIAVVRLAILEKFQQNPNLLDLLMNTGEDLLVQSNVHDDLWAVGMDEVQFNKWLTTNEGQIVKVPREVRPETVKQFPLIGKGKNLLGLLIMNVREQLRKDRRNSGDPLLKVKTSPYSVASTNPDTSTVDWMEV